MANDIAGLKGDIAPMRARLTAYSILLARVRTVDVDELREMAREHIYADPYYTGYTEHEQAQVQPDGTPPYLKTSGATDDDTDLQGTKMAGDPLPRSRSQDVRLEGAPPPQVDSRDVKPQAQVPAAGGPGSNPALGATPAVGPRAQTRNRRLFSHGCTR